MECEVSVAIWSGGRIRPYLIAELGNNHEGDLDVALELVAAAASAGADAVKLQVFGAAGFVRASETARVAQLERFRLDEQSVNAVHDSVRAAGLDFICTPLTLDCVAWLRPLVDVFKIASGDNDFVTLVDLVVAADRPIIVSTGFAATDDIVQLHHRLQAAKAEHAFLHCVGAYPTEIEDAHLATIMELRRNIHVPIGYSDHTIGIEACVVAVGLGASIVEKHLTLAHDFSDFRDHALSAEPDEFAELRGAIDRASALVGEPRNGILTGEADNVKAVRRSLVAGRNLGKGEIIKSGDLIFVRPGDGLPISSLADVLDRRVARAIGKDCLITLADLD